MIEAIPDTISLDALKKGDPQFTTLNNFFLMHFGRGNVDSDSLKVLPSLPLRTCHVRGVFVRIPAHGTPSLVIALRRASL